MLPFLQPKKMASVMMAARKPDGSVESKGLEDEKDPALMSSAEDLIRAVHSKDAAAVCEALEAAFSALACDPSDEMSEGQE